MHPAPVVPVPQQSVPLPGSPFVLDERTVLVASARSAVVAAVAAEQLERLCGHRPALVTAALSGSGAAGSRSGSSSGSGAIELRLTGTTGVAGSYRLTVEESGVVVEAGDEAGLLHGCATLTQLGDRTSDQPGTRFPAIRVEDAPRFAWRGLSLDVARHFHDVATVRAVIDVMASLKLNVLHLHLTDDQGWRIELPSRPELTARSGGTAVGGAPGGFYTAADYAGLVAFAAARGITVVPEVDVPGHVNAALHAIGALTPSGEPAAEYTGIEVGFSRLHAALPATDAFLRDVFSDLAAMTPGPWVHLGGDEVLTMEPAEYAQLVQAAAHQVRAAGKRVVGWQEVALADLGPDTVIQYWTHDGPTEPVVAAARAGARVVLSPARHVYVDQKYDASSPLGLEWAGHVELRDSYAWEPTDLLPGLPHECVAGVEAALWSETVVTRDDLFFLLLPRLAAVAEVAWSRPDQRDWDDFAARVTALAPRWTADGLTWYRSPQVEW